MKTWFWIILVVVIIAGATIWVNVINGNDANYNAKREIKIALEDLRRDPQNYSAAIRAGVGYYNLGLFDDAETYYKKATDINPSSETAWNNLGNTYRELLRYGDAQTAYQNAIQIKPDFAVVYINIADLYKRWPEDDGSRAGEIPQILEQGLAATENDIAILRALVDYYEEINQSGKAQKYKDLLAEKYKGETG